MGYRLPSDLRDDLEWYWNCAESEMGVRSSLGGQVATLNRLAPPDPVPTDDTEAKVSPLERWRLATPEERAVMRAERWDREDEAIRAYWETISTSDDSGHSSPEPRLDPRTHARASRVGGALSIVVKSSLGPRHQRVLFRVYGDPKSALVANELDRLKIYATTERGRDGLLSSAGKAYAAAHEEAVAIQRQGARMRRRAKLDWLLRESA